MGARTVNRDVKQAMRLVSIAWNTVQSSMSSIWQGSQIRPRTSNEIFKFESPPSGNEINIEVTPIVFVVPERAPNHKKLYICVKGRIDFESPFPKEPPPKIKNFSTQVGYFRHHRDHLEHVYGVHYDLDISNFEHPVFHAQMRPLMFFAKNIEEQFSDKRFVCNRVNEILRTVRMPSAEMDIFSVFAQIIADHLMHSNSGQEDKENFRKTLTCCSKFEGVAQKLNNFNRASTPFCYRSPCWYPSFNP